MRWTVLCLLLSVGAAPACRRHQVKLPATPEKALAALRQAAQGEALGLFDLLDQDSRWSVISTHRDQLKICQLVRAHYPADRQVGELRRCLEAEQAGEPRRYYAAQARASGLLATLRGLAGSERIEGSGARRQIHTSGAPLLLCRDGTGWGLCGARQALEERKVRTARDLASVEENVEVYKGR